MAQQYYHPWKRWFKRRQFTLSRGKDYHCMPHSMSIQIRTAAGRRGLRASVFIHEDSTITVRLTKRAQKKEKQ